MRKIIFLTLSSFLLTACAAGISDSLPVEKQAGLTSICVDERKTGLNYTSKEIGEFINASLKKKNIGYVVYNDANKDRCQYLLKYSFRGKKELVIRGKMTLRELTGERKILGEVAYKLRGDEKEIAQQTGLSGQIDKMIAELFKNY